MPKRILQSALLAASCFLCGSASIYAAGPNVQLFRPLPTKAGFTLTQTSTTLPTNQFLLSVYSNFAEKPLQFLTTSGESTVVDHLLTFDLVFGLGLFDFLDVGVDLPFTVSEELDSTFAQLAGDSGFNDIRLYLKAHLLKHGTFGFAVAPEVNIPSGDDADLLGDDTFAVGGRFVVDQELGRFFHSLNFGLLIRSRAATLGALRVDDQLSLHYGFKLSLDPHWQVGTEFFLLTAASDPFANEATTPIEIAPFVRRIVSPQWRAIVGGSAGLNQGFGTTSWRLFFGFEFTPQARAPQAVASVDAASIKASLREALAEQQARVTAEEIAALSIHFESGQWLIFPDSFPLLEKIARFLKQHSERRLVIEGHADTTGEPAYNEELAHKRAESVKRHLVSLGVPPQRLEVRSFGEARPLQKEDQPYDRTMNRRVEFRLQ